MKVTKTPNAGKAAFMAAVLVAILAAAAVLASLAGCDNSTGSTEKPGKEYETIAFDEERAWMADYLTIKKEKGIVVTSEIQEKIISAFGSAIVSPVVRDYISNPDGLTKHKLVILIDNSGTEPILSADGIHLPLTYLEGNADFNIMDKLIEFITQLAG